jgi:hypothetical protein
MENQDHQAVRQALRQMLARVPASVNDGSYNHATAYKKSAAQASKVINNPRASLMQLQQARAGLASFY